MSLSCPGAKHIKINALVRLEYRTTNQQTTKGRNIRCVTVEKQGCVNETVYGKRDDLRRGWWVQERDGRAVERKFFLNQRILEVWSCSAARLFRLDSDAYHQLLAERSLATPVEHDGGSAGAVAVGGKRKTDDTSVMRGRRTLSEQPKRAKSDSISSDSSSERSAGGN